MPRTQLRARRGSNDSFLDDEGGSQTEITLTSNEKGVIGYRSSEEVVDHQQDEDIKHTATVTVNGIKQELSSQNSSIQVDFGSTGSVTSGKSGSAHLHLYRSGSFDIEIEPDASDDRKGGGWTERNMNISISSAGGSPFVSASSRNLDKFVASSLEPSSPYQLPASRRGQPSDEIEQIVDNLTALGSGDARIHGTSRSVMRNLRTASKEANAYRGSALSHSLVSSDVLKRSMLDDDRDSRTNRDGFEHIFMSQSPELGKRSGYLAEADHKFLNHSLSLGIDDDHTTKPGVVAGTHHSVTSSSAVLSAMKALQAKVKDMESERDAILQQCHDLQGKLSGSRVGSSSSTSCPAHGTPDPIPTRTQNSINFTASSSDIFSSGRQNTGGESGDQPPTTAKWKENLSFAMDQEHHNQQQSEAASRETSHTKQRTFFHSPSYLDAQNKRAGDAGGDTQATVLSGATSTERQNETSTERQTVTSTGRAANISSTECPNAPYDAKSSAQSNHLAHANQGTNPNANTVDAGAKSPVAYHSNDDRSPRNGAHRLVQLKNQVSLSEERIATLNQEIKFLKEKVMESDSIRVDAVSKTSLLEKQVEQLKAQLLKLEHASMDKDEMIRSLQNQATSNEERFEALSQKHEKSIEYVQSVLQLNENLVSRLERYELSDLEDEEASAQESLRHGDHATSRASRNKMPPPKSRSNTTAKPPSRTTSRTTKNKTTHTKKVVRKRAKSSKSTTLAPSRATSQTTNKKKPIPRKASTRTSASQDLLHAHLAHKNLHEQLVEANLNKPVPFLLPKSATPSFSIYATAQQQLSDEQSFGVPDPSTPPRTHEHAVLHFNDDDDDFPDFSAKKRHSSTSKKRTSKSPVKAKKPHLTPGRSPSRGRRRGPEADVDELIQSLKQELSGLVDEFQQQGDGYDEELGKKIETKRQQLYMIQKYYDVMLHSSKRESVSPQTTRPRSPVRNVSAFDKKVRALKVLHDFREDELTEIKH